MTTQQMLHDFLKVGGFDTMAKEVLKETDLKRLNYCARVVLKNCIERSRHEDVRAKFAILGLI